MTNRIWLPDHATLDDRATEINRLLILMDASDEKARRRRWEAGVELLAAKRLIPYGEWEKWCDKSIARSQGDIRKIMQMAASSDPFAAHEEAKEANKDNNEKYRSISERAHERVPEPERVPELSSRTSNQPPKLTLVPKVDAAERVVDAWMALSLIDKIRVREHINSVEVEDVSNVA